jgi:excisionase family DNA binding protein
MPTKEVMDIREAAEYLGISADTLYKYLKERILPAFRMGNRWKLKRSLLDQWMAEQCDKYQVRNDGK